MGTKQSKQSRSARPLDDVRWYGEVRYIVDPVVGPLHLVDPDDVGFRWYKGLAYVIVTEGDDDLPRDDLSRDALPWVPCTSIWGLTMQRARLTHTPSHW